MSLQRNFLGNFKFGFCFLNVTEFPHLRLSLWKFFTLAIKVHFFQVSNFYYFVVLCLRWATLKAALVERRSKLGESKTIQQFSRDAEDIEAWVSEKLQTVLDESYKDPTNLQVFFLPSTNEPVNRLSFLLQHEWPSFRIWAGERGGSAKGL